MQVYIQLDGFFHPCNTVAREIVTKRIMFPGHLVVITAALTSECIVFPAFVHHVN